MRRVLQQVIANKEVVPVIYAFPVMMTPRTVEKRVRIVEAIHLPTLRAVPQSAQAVKDVTRPTVMMTA
jgi:hypothetical protein